MMPENTGFVVEPSKKIVTYWILRYSLPYLVLGLTLFYLLRLFMLSTAHLASDSPTVSKIGSYADYGIVIWIVFIALSLFYFILTKHRYKFQFTEDNIMIHKGFLFSNVEIIPYAQINHIFVAQNLIERILGLKHIFIQTPGRGEGLTDRIGLADVMHMAKKRLLMRPVRQYYRPSAFLFGLENAEELKQYIEGKVSSRIKH